MNAPGPIFSPLAATVGAAVEAACGRIAPSWPLDQLIAVNPYWGWTQLDFAGAARALDSLAASPMRMSRAYYRALWRSGRIGREGLERAAVDCGVGATVERLVAVLDEPESSASPLPLLSDWVDEGRDHTHAPAWRDAIAHQISQHCAAYFDEDQADWRPATSVGLYASWREAIAQDRGVVALMAAPAVTRRAPMLPEHPSTLLADALAVLGIPEDCATEVLTATLLRVSGWASWCAYLRWQARLKGGDDAHIVDLLAIRLAWELLLDDGERDPASVWARWQSALAASVQPGAQDPVAVWQRAHEIAYQVPLARALAREPVSMLGTPAVQAIFCIDVRSEVFRRALEDGAPDVETRGFAGFFGLPIRYSPLGTDASRPQLPGLLAPALNATERSGSAAADAAISRRRRARLAARAPVDSFSRAPASGFALVETVGIGYLGKLLARTLSRHGAHPVDLDGLNAAERRVLSPRLDLPVEALDESAALAEGALRGMGLTARFARLVVLVGHGSTSANNPHAAGLDCGACGGQTGEVNARVLAALLNDVAVRERLARRGIVIPETTRFVAALHDTTTDTVALFEKTDLPASHARDVEHFELTLRAAGQRARAERAEALGLGHLKGDPRALQHALHARARNWSETRPEWGLAGNAAFIVAPRARTRGLDLGGRAFLHDYDWRQDPEGSVLELIMTAPMIVTHWINMQYFASTVDNVRWGSGNKVLHNVVGGRIGVFEGNGGDLRIGLPLQSLHDGERFVHAPLRQSVFIEAPRTAIEAVAAKHEVVRRLVGNGWLHLFRIDPESNVVEAFATAGWSPWARAG